MSIHSMFVDLNECRLLEPTIIYCRLCVNLAIPWLYSSTVLQLYSSTVEYSTVLQLYSISPTGCRHQLLNLKSDEDAVIVCAF